MDVVVTGAAGYIGGQVALALSDAGHRVIGIDRRPCPPRLKDVFNQFVQADFDSDQAKTKLIQLQPNAIIHCAGTSLVGPSVKHPSDYYHNNVIKTIHLLDLVCNALPKTRVIFSSSASVYGGTSLFPYSEVDNCKPMSPYGESKRMIEQVMASYHHAYHLDYVAFRYFNACGADRLGRHGQEPGATHVIARILEATRDDGQFRVYGDDYDTPDGSCVRDYVHVEDIAHAHVCALDACVPSGIYNLGSNQGFSVKQVMSRARDVVGKMPYIGVEQRRTGDPAVLTANAEKFSKLMPNWRQYTLDDMIQHAWAWYVRKNL
jgi:UDP-glucose-4-epimerase GalE